MRRDENRRVCEGPELMQRMLNMRNAFERNACRVDTVNEVDFESSVLRLKG